MLRARRRLRDEFLALLTILTRELVREVNVQAIDITKCVQCQALAAHPREIGAVCDSFALHQCRPFFDGPGLEC